MAESDEQRDIREEFGELVNMTAKQLEDWLETDESKSVGQKDGGGESVGHESGRRIVAILHEKRGELSEDDYAHMRKVTGYVKRHLAQGPPEKEDMETSRWRYSLMNWGHDPRRGG